MKRLLFVILIVLGIAILSNAQVTVTKTSKGYIVEAVNLADKKIVRANDGILLFFNTKEDAYTDLITIIPQSSSAIDKIIDLLSQSKVSFELSEGRMKILTGTEQMILYVNNSKVRSKYGGKISEGVLLNQLGFCTGHKFLKSELPKILNTGVNKYLFVELRRRPACTSGGEGAVSCSTHKGIGKKGAGCSVTCADGYYACCNSPRNICYCRKKGE